MAVAGVRAAARYNVRPLLPGPEDAVRMLKREEALRRPVAQIEDQLRGIAVRREADAAQLRRLGAGNGCESHHHRDPSP